AAPDGEQAHEQALVGHRIEVVELAPRLEVRALRVQVVRADPPGRLARFPLRAGLGVSVFPVPAHARVAVAETVDPFAAERVVEDGGAVAARAAARHRLAPVDAVRGE